MTTGARERQWNFSLRPYRNPLLNAVHMTVWIAVLAILVLGAYLLLPHTWLAGFGADQNVVYEPLVFDPHWDPGGCRDPCGSYSSPAPSSSAGRSCKRGIGGWG